MDDGGEIIEVSSSPEDTPLPPRAAARSKRARAPPVALRRSSRRAATPNQPDASASKLKNKGKGKAKDEDVIIISDSDEEDSARPTDAIEAADVGAGPVKSKGKGRATEKENRNASVRRTNQATAGSSRLTTCPSIEDVNPDEVVADQEETFAEGPLVNLPTQLSTRPVLRGQGSTQHSELITADPVGAEETVKNPRLLPQLAPQLAPILPPLFLEDDFAMDVDEPVDLPPIPAFGGAAPAPEPNLEPVAQPWLRMNIDVPGLGLEPGLGPEPQVHHHHHHHHHAPANVPGIERPAAPAPHVVYDVDDPNGLAAPTNDVDFVNALDDGKLAEYVREVQDIFPNTPSAQIEGLVRQYFPAHGVLVLEPVLHDLMDEMNLSAGPRQDKGKGKRRLEEVDDVQEQRISVKLKIDYASTDRQSGGGPHYKKLALTQLTADWPYIPSAHIEITFISNNSLYAPTYLVLRQQEQAPEKPYKRKKTPRVPSGNKGKERADEAFDAEKAWVAQHVSGLAGIPRRRSLAAILVGEEANAGEGCGGVEDGIECGCCFDSYPFSAMAQCDEAHLFCATCVKSYAEAQLGSQTVEIVCMDTSGCKAVFSEAELRRILDEKLMTLYDRLSAQANLDKAGIEGLEECPFCEYRCVIDNEHEKLFRCRRMECLKISCRACKKLDHLPKTCQEVTEDGALDAQHEIEEAMTRALMRNCPSCKKGFVKQDGCNKIVCTYCRTLSCYVCRSVITGYDHFNQRAPVNGVPVAAGADANKCPLWDNSEQRHNNEVHAAAQEALKKFKAENPEVDADKLKLDIPKAGPSNVPARPHTVAAVAGLPAHLHANAHAHAYRPQAMGPMGHHRREQEAAQIRMAQARAARAHAAQHADAHLAQHLMPDRWWAGYNRIAPAAPIAPDVPFGHGALAAHIGAAAAAPQGNPYRHFAQPAAAAPQGHAHRHHQHHAPPVPQLQVNFGAEGGVGVQFHFRPPPRPQEHAQALLQPQPHRHQAAAVIPARTRAEVLRADRARLIEERRQAEEDRRAAMVAEMEVAQERRARARRRGARHVR